MVAEKYSVANPEILFDGKVLTNKVLLAQCDILTHKISVGRGEFIDGLKEASYFLKILMDPEAEAILNEIFNKGVVELKVTDPATMHEYQSKVFIKQIPLMGYGRVVTLKLVHSD
jgi:hypothetical protein